MHQNARNVTNTQKLSSNAVTDSQKLSSNANNDAGQWELKHFSDDYDEMLA